MGLIILILKGSYSNQCKELAKNLTNIATKNKLSLAKVMQVYSKFNDRIYRDDSANGGRFTMYKPVLEEQTLGLTEWYFNFPKN
ncbi:MAG: hypothetical protein NTZ83_00110 [Candidatus Pacearchaeota archaeon]|nr:hypothetical protein [Candidatus Pacearchaeota archaeon]